MRAVKLFGPRDLRLVEEETPTAAPDEVLLRVEAVGVCGSDLHYYEECRIGNNRVTSPLILGHEFAGVVEASGGAAGEDLVGQRVAVEPGRTCGACEFCLCGEYNLCPRIQFPGGPGCDGALRDVMPVPAAMCFPVPQEMTSPEAAAMEPLAVALYAAELASLKAGESAAVLGLGPIGLLTAMAARVSGAGLIYGTDVLAYRVDAAGRFCLDKAFNASETDTVEAILEATKGRGVDVTFDAARSPETAGLACKVTRPGGRCILVGISGNEDDLMPVSEGRRKGLEVRWCRRFRHNYPRAIALAHSGRLDVKPMLTHEFPLEKAGEAFETVSHARDGVLKATIVLA